MEVDQRAVFIAGIIIVLLGGFAMFLTGKKRGGRYWSYGWACLWLSGGAAQLASNHVAFGLLYPILGSAFALLLYLGSLRFAGLERAAWVLPLAFAVTSLRVALQPVVPAEWTQFGGAATITLAAVGSAAVLAPLSLSRRRNAWERVLVVCPALLAFGSWFYAYQWAVGASPIFSQFVWLVLGIVATGLQLGALLGQRTREAVQERAMLEAVIESVPMGLALTDADEQVQMINETFARRFAASAAEMLGRSSRDLGAQFLAQLELEDSRALLRQAGDVFDSRERLITPDLQFRDGSTWVGLTSEVREQKGNSSGRVWLLHEVTEERRLEQQLQRARQLETLGRLAGGVAHDFNNKLTAVLGTASLLKRSLEAGDPRREQLRDLEEAALYCAAVTRDLLDFSQQAPRSPEPIALRPFLEGLCEGLRAELPAGAHLVIDTEADVPAAVVADRHQLERVVTNLVLNARDAIEAEGTIRVEGRAHGPGEVEIAVQDDGFGIDKETRERIFDPFFSTKGEGRGSGLGLAIVYGIVTSHGGEVNVESSPGEGARFSTTWRSAAVATPVASAQAKEARPGRGERVLVVDDEAPVRRVLRRMLEQAGYAVVEAGDGERALEITEEAESGVDLIVADVSMPGMDGPELLDRLRQRGSRLPAILTSGNFGSLERSADVQMLQKPFRAGDVVAAVARGLTP